MGERGAWVGGELVYGRNSHSDFAGDKPTTPGVFGEAGYRFGAKGKARPFVRGAVGVLNHQYGTATSPGGGEGSYGGSDWGLGVMGGGGVEIPVGRMAVRGEVRYLARKETTSIPILVGVSIRSAGGEPSVLSPGRSAVYVLGAVAWLGWRNR